MPGKGRKRCSEKGCRKLRVAGSEWCADHLTEASSSPGDSVLKLNEVEALRFGKLDAEMRNALQGIRLIVLEMEKLQRETQDKLRTYEGNKKLMKERLEGIRPEYEEFVAALAEKYGVDDPSRMSIDPDTGIVRYLSR